MASINDVAKLAGVSITTVSRVLNNTSLVSENAKSRVFKAVEELGFQLTVYNKLQDKSKNKAILVVTSILNDIVLEGMRDMGNKLGYDIMIEYLGIGCSDSNSLKYVKSGFFSGVIFFNIFEFSEEMKSIIDKYPNIQCGESINNKNSMLISIDNRRAAYDATSYLISKNCKKIAYIGLKSESSFSFSSEREKGYREALFDNNLEIDSSLIFRMNFDIISKNKIIDDIVHSFNKVDAIFCEMDLIAISVVEQLHENNFKIPEDIMVMGFDDNIFAQVIRPKLTTIAQPFYELGKECIQNLVFLINQELNPGKKLYLNHELIIRESTK
ncbi:MAG: LacI family DNA-binding transcriptional regulator [Fusobacteriaceae bacterium]|nr:LacI family DNA-binding transcriptional regulator [Fusobacteriaceae bacterium]MBN2838690.1 LacI family DNA-binding transcriptional regulator [Fusobacteriaceae bacterium]